MRLFFAIRPDRKAIQTLTSWQNVLIHNIPELKITPKSNLHLTLQFFAELDPAHLQTLCDIGSSLSKNTPSFLCRSAEAGFFPEEGPARVIWAGIALHPVLRQCYEELLSALQHAQIPYEHRDFVPHITIARSQKSNISENISKLLRSKSLPSFSFNAASLELIESVLSPAGAEYKSLYSFPLTRNNSHDELSI